MRIKPIRSLDFEFWRRYEHSYNVARERSGKEEGTVESVYSFDLKKPIQLQIGDTPSWFSPIELEIVGKEDPVFLSIDEVLKNMDLEVRNLDSLAYHLSGTRGLYQGATTKEHATNIIYGVNRAHPLINGNKRASLTLGAAFLRKNGYNILPVPNQDVADFERTLAGIAIETASGNMNHQSLYFALRPFIQKGKSGNGLFSLMNEYPGLHETLRIN